MMIYKNHNINKNIMGLTADQIYTTELKIKEVSRKQQKQKIQEGSNNIDGRVTSIKFQKKITANPDCENAT